MIFTPENIKKQIFNKSFKGFDREEVHAFLEKLSTEFETLVGENEAVKKELEEIKQKFSELAQNDKESQASSNNPKEDSNHLITEAQNKADEILRLAEEKSAQMLQKSREEVDILKSALINLREEKEILLTKLKTIINYQAHLLEMKTDDSEEELKNKKKTETTSDVDVDVNNIVEKLL